MPTPPSDSSEVNDFELDLLIEAIYQKYKYDFRRYSRASLTRRLQAALARMHMSSLSALQARVLHESGFFMELLQYLTIPVTEMFRDPSYFKAIREQVVPHLRTYPSIKIWCAGCSTGEEAYSLAILLAEEGLIERTLIYATDINPRVLKRAQDGIYNTDVIQKYTQNYQQSGGKRGFSDYYEVAYDAVKISASLKNHLLFTDHSLATDSVFSEVQMVSCRNVLIYFEKDLQQRASQLFLDSLVPGGFLGLGEKESLRFSPIANHFDIFVPSSRIYQKMAVPKPRSLYDGT